MKTIFTLKNTFAILLACCIIASVSEGWGQTKHVVGVTNNVFTPDELKINVGDTVEWQNTQGWHNVNGTKTTFPDNPESFGNSTGSNWVFSYVFNTPGKYDYQCDPHVTLGMTGKIEVEAANDDDHKHLLTINFTGMAPHNGQNLYLSVVEKDSGKEVERKVEDIHSSFMVQVSGIEKDHSYFINFFADHNGNGMYDAPPTDHAWRLELNNVMGDTTLNFAHNTNFTDIMWQNLLVVNFSGMNPHDGQTLHFRVVEQGTGTEVFRTETTVEPEFSVNAPGIEVGKSYHVDFYSDHNGNGMYDAPPTDHAWRLELNNVMGDTTLNFAHNTDFTDIMWQYRLVVNFSGMNPHAGQTLHFRVVEQGTGTEVFRTETTVEPGFSVNAPGIEVGKSYHVDFYSDHNGNGMYDAPPTDHAWRLELNNVTGDTTLNFAHNTNFTDIQVTTGIGSVLAPESRIYPNPASTTLKIDVERELENMSIAIIDIAGKTHLVSHRSNERTVELDLGSVPSGIYFVRITGNDFIQTHRLVKR